MRMKMILTVLIVVVVGLVSFGCSGGGSVDGNGNGGGVASNDTTNLKQVGQQRAGETLVTVLSETGQLNQGPNNFVVEFRKAADNKLTDVGDVQLQSIMPMPGMSPMSAGASAEPSGTPGRYNVTADFSMTGKWNFTVIFKGQRVMIPINVATK